MVAKAPPSVKGLIATWSQRAEPADAIPKKSSLKGLKHLRPMHVQNRVQQFSRPTDVPVDAPKRGGFVKQRIAALEDVRAACQYALDRLQGDKRPQGQPGAWPTEAAPAGSEVALGTSPATPATPSSSPDSIETESQALMREIEEMDIMSMSASRHSGCPTPTIHPMVRAPTDFQRATGLGVGTSAIPPLSPSVAAAGTATVFGTRRYKRSPLADEASEVRAVTRVPRRLVSDTHWLKGNKKPATATSPSILPLALRKPTSQLPIAKYYINSYDQEICDDLPPRLQRVTPPSAPAPGDDKEDFTQFRVTGRFGILSSRPRLVARPRFGENVSPTKARQAQNTFPRVPKLRRRTPPQVTLDFFNRLWPNGMRKPSH